MINNIPQNQNIAIYKEEELYENSTILNFRIVQKEGNREVTREVSHYNLDVIISIGYRANSKKATKFRQWGTSVLKKHNAQYPSIEIKKFDLSHDRFLIIDEKEIYHFGASLKDLGKKWFAVSKMDINSLEIIKKLGK
jgi:hypothetical protein